MTGRRDIQDMSQAFWTKTEVEGYPAWTGSNGTIALTVIPALGSKVISLLHVPTGREWLSHTGLPLGNKGYASSFASGDGTGWDEMFPTVDSCVFPDVPWKGVELPDHGEVWSLPWQAVHSDGKLLCTVQGVRLPFELDKTYSFTRSGRLRIDYTACNVSSHPLPFLWAAHPLFRIHEGMEIAVPAGLDQIAVSYSHQDRLGKRGTVRKWPAPLDEHMNIRLDVAQAKSAAVAEKFYFVGDLPEGWAALRDPASKEQLTMHFPKEQVPYLAIWANYGGYSGHYHVALEPATGFLDHLGDAIGRSMAAVMPAKGHYQWYLELDLTSG